MQTIFYARVSTAEQTLEHQEAQARAAGYEIDKVLADQGISGVSVLLKDRPEGARLFDILREGDTLVVRWLDRLGRNYDDVTNNVREFISRGVIVRTVIGYLKFDGQVTDPMGKLMRDTQLGMLAAMAESQAVATKEAQLAGIANAQAKEDKYLGRKPKYDQAQYQTVLDMLNKGHGVSAIAKETGLKRGSIYRIKNEPEAAEKALRVWGLIASDASEPVTAAQAAPPNG